MALQESWHIRSRGRTCAATETPFTDGEAIVTALYPDPESSGYLRRDYTLDAWKARGEDAEKPFSHWHGKFTVPPDPSEDDPVKKLAPEELLARLVEEDEEHTENTRYILAVMLERRRVLRETDQQRTPDGILRVYENRKTGDVFIVRDPNIPLDEVEAVQTEVLLMLENNGKPPGLATETDQEPGSESQTDSESGPQSESDPSDPPNATP